MNPEMQGPPVAGGPVGAMFNMLLRLEFRGKPPQALGAAAGHCFNEPVLVPSLVPGHEGWLLAVVDQQTGTVGLQPRRVDHRCRESGRRSRGQDQRFRIVCGRRCTVGGWARRVGAGVRTALPIGYRKRRCPETPSSGARAHRARCVAKRRMRAAPGRAVIGIVELDARSPRPASCPGSTTSDARASSERSWRRSCSPRPRWARTGHRPSESHRRRPWCCACLRRRAPSGRRKVPAACPAAAAKARATG